MVIVEHVGIGSCSENKWNPSGDDVRTRAAVSPDSICVESSVHVSVDARVVAYLAKMQK